MQVTLILADAAQVADGKLNLLGGGWNTTGPDPIPSAIGLVIQVPWDQTNRKHKLELALVDADGHAFMAPTENGGFAALKFDAEFEVGRPPGVAPGTPLVSSLAVNIPPLPLAPGKSYEWVLSVNRQSKDEWKLPFTVRQQPIRMVG